MRACCAAAPLRHAYGKHAAPRQACRAASAALVYPRLQLLDHQTKRQAGPGQGLRPGPAAGRAAAPAAADVTVMAAAVRPHWRAPRLGEGEHAHLSTRPRAWRASVAASNEAKLLPAQQ